MLGTDQVRLGTDQVRLDRTLSASTFGYDGASRVTIRSGDAVPSLPPNNVAAGPASFQTVRDGEAYRLDSAQNLVTRQSVRDGLAGPVVPLTPDSSGRNRPGTLDGVPLTYDANGNLLTQGDLRFEYDFRNRLTRVLDSGGQELAAYEYDAFNRRVSKTVAGSRTDFVWSGWQVVEEYRDGNLTRRRLFGSGLDEIVFEQGDVDGDGSLETSYYPVYDSIGNLVALTGDDGTAFERYSYTPFGREQTITVDALPPAIRQLLLRGDEIRVDLTEKVVSEEVLDAVTDGRIRVEDVSTGTPLDLDVRFPSIPAPTPPQSTTGDPGQTSAASVTRTSAPALTASGVLTTTLDYQSDQQARRFALVLTTPPAAGTELRLVIAADALRDPFGNAATAGADQTFPWSATDTVLADTEPPAVHAVRVRQGFLEVEFDEEPDLATVPTGVTVTPTGGTALALGWSSLGDGFTVRSDETLPAGTLDLDIATTVQDLAGSPLATAYGQQFQVVGSGADLELFEAHDERIIPTSSVGNVHGFHGLPMDAETGLIYVRNRYYDPELGRFITADPLGYVDGPSMYGAFLYDPVNRADPLGLCVMYLPCPEIVQDTVHGMRADLGKMGLGLVDLVSGGRLSGSYAGAQAYARQTGTTGDRVRAGIEAYVTQRDSVRTLGYSTAEDPWQHTEDLIGIQAVQDAGTLLGTAYADRDWEMVLEGTGKLLEGSGQISSTVLVFYAPAEAAVARSRAGFGVHKGGLLDELSQAGIKHSPKDILRVGRDPNGRIVFLESGNARAGLQHIASRHGDDFARVGVSEAEIPDLVIKATTRGRIVGMQGSRPIYDVAFGVLTRRVAVTVGDNGFIVGANPIGR